jgi:hypothetical protein
MRTGTTSLHIFFFHVVLLSAIVTRVEAISKKKMYLDCMGEEVKYRWTKFMEDSMHPTCGVRTLYRGKSFTVNVREWNTCSLDDQMRASNMFHIEIVQAAVMCSEYAQVEPWFYGGFHLTPRDVILKNTCWTNEGVEHLDQSVQGGTVFHTQAMQHLRGEEDTALFQKQHMNRNNPNIPNIQASTECSYVVP